MHEFRLYRVEGSWMQEDFVSSSGQVGPPPAHRRWSRRLIARGVPHGVKPRLRRWMLAAAQRALGRGLTHLDYDWVISTGVLEMGRHTAHYRPIVRHSGKSTSAKVRIGAFCNIAQDTEFLLGGEHHVDWITGNPLTSRYGVGPPGASEGFSKGDIEVGNDVWIGIKALILSGIKIGNGAVVGAGAVVAKDVRPYAIVVGNPAREIRRRFTDDQIAALESIAWWDWPVDKILKHADLLCSPDADTFIRQFSAT